MKTWHSFEVNDSNIYKYLALSIKGVKEALRKSPVEKDDYNDDHNDEEFSFPDLPKPPNPFGGFNGGSFSGGGANSSW